MNRRKVLYAVGSATAYGATTGATTAESREEKLGAKADERDDTDEQAGGEQFCPLDNSVSFSKYGTDEQRPHFEMAVTGELELPSGERVQQTRRALTGPSGQVAMEVPYSGELTRLSVSGNVKVKIRQRDACRMRG